MKVLDSHTSLLLDDDIQTGWRDGTRKPHKIFLVRHGQSIWNGCKRISGQGNPPLSATGLKQVSHLVLALAGEPLTAVHTSPLDRSMNTGRPVAEHHDVPLHLHEDLMEQNFGALEGRYRDERDAEAKRLWALRKADPMGFRPPGGGETFAELLSRVLFCLNGILREQRGPVLIVGHRNTNRVILGALAGWTAGEALDAAPRNQYLYEILPGTRAKVNTIRLEETPRHHSGLIL